MQGTVLIVDGDTAVRSLLTSNLTLAGYRIACAANLTEAEEVVRRTRPDVALLEWNGLTPGLLFVRQMRCRRRTSDMAVIVLSARAGEQERITALESGADDFVTKPFSMRELLARVRAVLRRRAPTAGRRGDRGGWPQRRPGGTTRPSRRRRDSDTEKRIPAAAFLRHSRAKDADSFEAPRRNLGRQRFRRRAHGRRARA